MTITEYLERRSAETESDIDASIAAGKTSRIINAQRDYLGAIIEALEVARGRASFDSLSLSAKIVYQGAKVRALA